MPRVLVTSARRAGAVVAAVALLTLTACTGGGTTTATPTPDESPTAVVTESPSASPTPTALTEEDVLAALPEAAKSESFDGAVAFSAFMAGESQALARTGDTSLFAYLSDAGCQFCLSVLERAEEDARLGLTMAGGELEFDVWGAGQGLQTDGTWVVDLPIEIAAMTYFEPDGTVASEVPADSLVGRFHMEWGGERFSLLEVATVDEN
ncbi:DUF6318 family protein [Demequina sp. B12]|uniref:DUF6318 family protein n=1 Tax=Demequina sp. B12 TaxID=2992757 RepID=UPI00237B1743|nr:DUF6318 family protein [Demequina sp. B12]MDE0572713.1 DUF6318 family protein [Demequina sp. B12]